MEKYEVNEQLADVSGSSESNITIQTGFEFQDPRYQRIGGWLIVIMLGLIFTPLNLIFSLINNYLPVFTQGALTLILTKGNEAYNPTLAAMLLFEIMGNVFYAVFSIVILVYFFKKKRNVPKFMIIYYLSNLGFIFIDSIWTYLIPILTQNDHTDIFINMGRGITTSLIWVTYFIKSERVRNTFIR